MATRRLDEGWTISCGIWPPFLMPAPRDVVSALREQGILGRGVSGLEPLGEQWVYARRWTYQTRFDLGGEDERFLLRFEDLAGHGEVRLNGRRLALFGPGELTLDITGACEAENQLEVVFDPSLPDGAPRGILGPVWLRETSYVELRRVRAHGAGGVIKVEADLTAHTAGRFLIRCQVSLDGEMVATSEVYERLRAAEGHVRHAVKLPEAAPWDGKTYYTLRLQIERSGVACDSVLMNVAMDAPRPKRVARVSPHRLRERDLLRALRALGAEAVGPGEEGGLLPPDLLPEGLLVAGAADCPEPARAAALPTLRAMEALAGGERFWPPGTPVWRVTLSPCPDGEAEAARYGANAMGDAARYARISRFVQAEALGAKALDARRAGRAFAVCAAEDAPRYASDALIEHSGLRRPAFAALRKAWGDCAALAQPEAPAARGPLTVWIHSDRGGKRPVTVTAAVYQMNGALIASASYAAMAGETAPLGELAASLPSEGAVIARTELSDGGKTVRIDQVLVLAGGGPALEALLSPPRAELRLRDGFLACEGRVAALGVAAGDFYGALLPGETVALPEGIAPEDVESLNALIL